MKENTFVVTVNKDGQYNTKMYSEEDYNSKVVPFLSEHYTPDQYSVAGLQDTTAENITEDGQYIVSVDANGATHRKTYTGKELLGGKLTTIGQQFPDYRLQYVDGAVRPAEGSDDIIAVPWQKQMDAKVAQLKDNIGRTLNEIDETASGVKGANLSDLVKERGDAMANFANMAVYNGLTKTTEELEAMHQEDIDRRDLRDINKELEEVNSQLSEWIAHEVDVEDYLGENMQWILDNAARKEELLARKADLVSRQTSNPFYKKEDRRLNEIADNVLAKAYPAMADLSVEGDLITANNPDADIWQAARYFADKAKTTLSAPDDNANGFVSFLKGHGATFSDPDFWLAGLESISSNMKVKKVFDSISSKLASYADQNIEKELTDGDLDYLLSDAEKQLLISFVTASEAEALRAQNTNNMYKAGLTSANSLGFMAQFILTGGIGDAFAAGTKGAAKGLATWLAKNTGKVGRSLAIDAAVASTTLAGKGALATAGAVVTPLLKTIPMTLMQTGLYKEYAQKLTERDEAGNLKYDYDTAVLPALRDAGLEVWSEMALEPVLSVFGKTMGIGLDKLAGKSKIAAMFNTKLDDLAKFFHNREAMEILTKAGFDGYFEEIGEEILGAGVSSLWEPEAWNQFWEKDNLVSMAVAFAPMSIIGGGMSMANYVKREMAYDEIAPSVQDMLARRGMAPALINQLFNRDVNTMQDVADKISGIINPIIESGNITADEFKTLYDFAGATAQKDIANALVKRAEEDRRIVMRNDMDQRMNGKQYTGKDADGNETVSYYEDENGNRRYVVVDAGNTDGLSLSMNAEGKDLKIVNVNDIEVTTMGADAFFDNMWKESQASAEAQRMKDDAAKQRQSVAQALKSGKPVLMYNPKTNERENYIFLGWNGDSAIMANANTNEEELRSVQDLANALHISDSVQTDAQMEQAQIDESRKNDSIARSANDYKGAPVNFNGVSGTLLRVSSRGDENGNPSLVASVITSNGELVPVNVTADMIEDFIQARKEVVASGNAEAADRRARDHERKEQQRKDSEAYRSSKEKYTNPDGSVREGEFLENDPRGYAMYSDGKYGKADTDATLAAALANAQTKAQQALEAKEAEANPDVKAGLRDQYDRAVAALDTLDTLLNERHQDESSNGALSPEAARAKYQEYEDLGLNDDEIYELGMNSIRETADRIAALPAPAVSTDVQSYMDQKKKYNEAVAAEQKKIDYWTSILNAPMTESEKKDVARANARMQRRVADILTEKAATKDAGALARLDKELKDVAEGFIGQAIADINTEADPVVISTAATIEKDMRDAGSSEKSIASVLGAIKDGFQPRGIFDPRSGAIFFIADYNTDVAEARTTFIHERQHKRTRDAGLVDVLIDRLGLSGMTEEEKKAVLLPELGKLIRTSFYSGKTSREIADEIISYSVEHEFNGTLDTLGLNDIITNFAKNIDNERSNAAGISEPGRNGNVNESYRVADQGDERAQGTESGAVAGEGSGSLEGGEESVGLTEKTQKELAGKGLVMDGGVVMASALSDLKQETGYLTPNEISPEAEAVAFSIRTKNAWAENYRKYPDSEERVIRALENLAERMAADELVSGVISQGSYKYGKKANGSFAGPLRTNIEYVVTFDMDTTCPRTFQYLNYVKQIEKRIGRPLTQTECIQLTEMMRMYGQQIPCVYCYSENKRQAMKQYYTDFMTARQAVLNAATDEEALEHMYGHATSKAAKESKDPAVALTEAAYKVFQEWRANRSSAYNPSLKMLWYQYANDRNVVLTVLDQLYADGRIMTDLNDDTIAAVVDTELRINDPAAVKVVQDIVSEWKWDAIEDREHSDYVPVDEDDLVVDPRTLSLWREMTSYAKSASQAKSVLRYVPYTDELKKLSEEQKAYINGMGGVRMHSSNDFRIDYVFDYFQFMADMAANKMFGHTYTKSPEFVRIFGNSGYKINMSIAAYEDENGKIRMNEDEGFNWDEAKRLREAFPNAGVMLMATSDNQIQMALDSDWIDMFIPFHSSSLPKAVWYNMRAWQDYSSVQNEAFLNGDEMKAALIADGVEIPKKIKASEVVQMYLEHFKIKTIIGTSGKNKGKRLRPHFLPGPTVVDGQYVPGHNNDPELYKQLCMEYGVHPRFYGVKVKDAEGNTIDITEHPGYIKCIKETSRTDTPQTAIQFNFDQPSEALGGKTPIEYAFDELQVRAAAEMQSAGAPVRDIYKSLEKDTFGIVPQFIDTIIKHKETTGKDYPLDYLTPDSRKWFLTERKALEEAYKDVETIPYHRNEYDIDGEPMARVANTAEEQAEIQQALDFMNGVKPFAEEGGDIRFSVRTKPAPKNTGIGYKVFYLKDGKLYPPMVANPDGADTPVGVWLDADAAPQAGTSKTGRKKVKAGGKGTQGGSGTLAYRPGWHLGEIPYALQFNRGPKVDNPLGITGKNGKVIKVGKYFPANFVWAEVEYAKDVDYQDEAMSYGYNEAGNFQHSLAGLPKVPEDGSYTYRTNANPATDPWIITGAMKVNRILTDSEVDELVSKAGREPQAREDNPKAFEERMAVVNSEQKKADGQYADAAELDEIMFRLSNNNRATITKWLDKWAEARVNEVAQKYGANTPRESFVEAAEQQKQDILSYLDKLNDSTMQLAWARWFCTGAVQMGAEDMPKVRQAVKIAKIHKVDPLQYDSPMAIIDQWPESVKEDPINPDEVPTLHKVKELPDGIVIYDVDESEESRKNMREIINTHFGKDCSPWCLLQGDGKGKLTKYSADYWYNTYNAYTKQVAFKNGKLVAFSANSSEDRLWWDRQDSSHHGIPVIGKIKGDKLGRSATMEYSPEDGSLISVTNIVKGNRKDGKYMEWFSLENETPRLEETFEHGYLVGKRIINYENGQIRKDENYENGSLSGRAVTYFDDGQIENEANYVNGRLEGPFAYYHENGQVYYTGTYERGDKVGRWQTFYKNGQISADEVYAKSWKPLESVTYYPDGSKKSESHSVSRPYGFGTVSEQEWDEQGRLVRSVRMMESSTSHGYYDGDLHEITEYEYNGLGITMKKVEAYQGQRGMTLYSALYFDDVLQKQTFVDKGAYNYNDVIYDEWYTADGKLATVTVQKLEKYNGDTVVDQLKYKYDEDGNVSVKHLMMPRGLGLVKDEDLLVSETRDLLPGETIPSVDKLYQDYQAKQLNPEEEQEKPAPAKKTGKSIKDTVEETLAAANLYMDEDMGGDISIGGTVNGEEYSFIVFDDFTYEDFLANGYTEDELGRATPEQEEAYAKVQDEIDYYQTNGYWRDEAEGEPMFRTADEREKLFQDAKDEFGTTRDFREAGYLLPDGSMLDFSEKNNGGEPGRRGADHRDIARVINDRNYGTMTEYLDDFINEGAIRLIPESGAFSIAQQPTKEQKNMLRDFIYRYNGEVEVEIYKNGHSVADPYYRERTSPTRVLNDIDAYFKDGTIPEGNAPMFRMVEITPETRAEMEQIEAIARMNGTYLKAPNGADTKLNEEQWSMVRTKAFKNWFGDWENDPANASKVVDENGEPMVVYHGSDYRPLKKEIGDGVFRERSGMFGRAVYFTNEYNIASDYADEKLDINDNREYLKSEDKQDYIYDNGYVTEAFLNIRDTERIHDMPSRGENVKYFSAKANEIKSATDNNGSFDPNDPDIRFRVSEEQDEEFRKAYQEGDSEKASKMVRDAFKAMYPNTKVVDENGEPLVVYHVTDADERFNKFDSDIARHGFFFSDSETFANEWETITGKKKYACFMNLENPNELDAQERNWAEMSSLGFGAEDTDELAFNTKEEGYDGLILRNVEEGGVYTEVLTDYVAFNSDQIKSADPFTFDDNGELIPLSERFNTETDDIRFRISGENAIFAEEDASELANDIANEVYRQISSQENTGDLATEVDSESDGEVLFRFIGELGADRLDKTDGGRRILNLIEVKKYYDPASAENIKRAYGWELDKDAKGNPVWKYEENDFGIKDLNIKDGAKLSDVINDEGLFAAYPELKNYALAIEELKDASGYFDESNKKIVLGKGAEKEDDRLTLIHEIQHFIQSKEGWVRGTNDKDPLILDTVKDILPYIREDLGMFLKSAAKRIFNKSYKKESESNFRFFKDKWGFSPIEYLSHLKKANYLAYEAYLRKAGEVEARNAEKRADMTALERRRSLAPETEDRPRSRQWRERPYEDVMFRIGPAAEMKKKGIVNYLSADQMTDFTNRMITAGFTPEELSTINDRAMENGGDYSVPIMEHFAMLAEKDALDAHDQEMVEKARQELVSIIGAKDETFDQNDMLWVAYDAVHGDEEGIYNQIHNRKVKRALDEASSVEPDMTLADYLKKAAEAKDDLIAQYTALRELANSLTRIMDAMSARRDYDRVTVGKLVSLTDDVLTSKLMDDVTNGEIKRLTSIIRRANGMRDIQSRVNELYNLILTNNLRRLKGLFEKELKKKAVKVDSNNVVNQGALDLNGQIAMGAMKENLTSFTEDPSGNIVISQTLADKIADALDRASTAEDAEAAKADMELLGLTFARDYIDGVVASEKEEQQLRDALKDADEALRKGNMNQIEHLQFVKEQTRALAECRTERVGKFTTLLQKMQDLTAASHELALMMNEKAKQRVEQIHHDANSDMQGVPSDEHPKDATFLQRLSNNPFTQFFFRPLATFDQMLRLFGNKSVNGEGYLWNRFMRGWIDATGKEYKALQAAYQILDDKVSLVFGKKMRWSDLYSVEDKMPKATIRFWDGGVMKEHELTQGNLLYIMLADQMTDGRMKLRAMGITEDDVDAIRRQMDSRFLDLADWIVNDFLPSRRDAYNEVHERMFGASMSKVQNYFPLKVLSNARTQQVDVASASTDPSTPSTVTGSIMKRTRNALALDVMGTDAFSLVIEHVQKMEHWAAFAEWNRDLSDLLSYKRFRNQVQNMTSIYGSQRNLWTEFVDTAMIAAGSYKGKSGKLDPAFNRMAKGVTAAKISLRVFTAIKQFLSFPAYFSEANPVYLAEGFFKGWNWSMDNLPLFEKRWKSRQAGDHILAEGNLGKINEYLARIGMTPNALVDAFTVSIGSYAIYKTKYNKYVKMGFTPEAADKRAKQDAVILYNETQQSSEAAFMSSMQSGRSTLEKMFTVFRNSSMGYQRQVHDALRNYKRRLTPGYKKDSIEFMTKQLIREGLSDRQAMKAAKGLFARQGFKDATRLMIFGYGLQFFWNLAPYLPYLLFGDDDDKKKEMLVDAAQKGVFGSLEGLTGGNLMSEAGNLLLFGEGLNNWDPSLLPLVSDFTNLYQEFGKDNVRAINDLVNLGIQMSIGVNPQTLEDAVVAIVDACDGDLGTAKEAMLLGLRLISAPQTSLDQLYLDEIDMDALAAKDLTIPELAERYAKYKKMKGAGSMTPLYSLDPELDDKITDKYLSSFENKAKERLEGIESDGRYAELAEEAKAMDTRVKDLRKLAKAGDEDAEKELMDIFLSPDYGSLIMFNELSKDVKAAINNAISAPTREEMAEHLDEAERLRSNILQDFGDRESNETWFRAKYTQYTKGFLPEMARLEKKYSDEFAKTNPKYEEWMKKHQEDLDSAADKAKANAERVAEIDAELKKYEIELPNGKKRYFNQPARKKLQEEKKALKEEGTTERTYLNKLKKQEGYTPEDFMPPAIYNSPEFQTYLEFKSLGSASGNTFNFKTISEWETKMKEAEDLETKAKYRRMIDERMVLLGQQITRKLNGVDDEDDGFSLDIDSDLE